MLMLVPIMKALGRVAAFVMAVLLAISSAPLYVCAQSAIPPCMPKMAHAGCDQTDDSASLACCCTAKDPVSQTPATDASASPALQPLEGRPFASVLSGTLDIRFSDVTLQAYRNCDLPTLFSTFLL